MAEEKVRMGFSYPTIMKQDLEDLAKDHGMKLMGYIKLIIRKEINRLKEAK